MGGNTTVKADMATSIMQIYSRKTLSIAQSKLLFWQFCLLDPELRLAVQPGDEVKFNTESPLTGSGILANEDTPIGIEKMGTGEVKFKVSEFGRAVEYSRAVDKASMINMLEKASRQLGAHAGQTFDKYLRDLFFTTANKHNCTTTGISGAAYTNVDSPLNAKNLDSIKEKAADLNFPLWSEASRGNFGIFVGTNRQLRQINRDTLFTNKKNYADPKSWLTGEVGMFEGTVFLTSTNMNEKILANAAAGGAKNCHRGLYICPGAIGIVRSIAMELFTKPFDELTRKQVTGWYALLGAGILQDFIYEVATTDDIPA